MIICLTFLIGMAWLHAQMIREYFSRELSEAKAVYTENFKRVEMIYPNYNGNETHQNRTHQTFNR